MEIVIANEQDSNSRFVAIGGFNQYPLAASKDCENLLTALSWMFCFSPAQHTVKLVKVLKDFGDVSKTI